MKLRWMILCFLLVGTFFVSASIDVHNVVFEDDYIRNSSIVGEVNLTIEGEGLEVDVTSNLDQAIPLEDFLVANGAPYVCNPYDCSEGYSLGTASAEKVISLTNSKKSYGGFYLEGEDVEITSLNFNLSSDFPKSTKEPLNFRAFEDSGWSFRVFSDTFSKEVYRGCFDLSDSEPGPVIGKANYCETISLPNTNKVSVGATVNLEDTKDLKMTLYPEDSTADLGSCTFNPGAGETACEIEADPDTYFSEGNYYVCVGNANGDATKYHLYQDTKGESCGFIFDQGASSSTQDYDIFASAVMYEDGSSLDISGLDFEDLALKADNLIAEKYGRDCTKGCILPIEFSGIDQNLKIEDVELYYLKTGGEVSVTKAYDLTSTPAVFDYSGILDLELTGFRATKEGDYKIYIGDKKILDEDIDFVPAPIVTAVSPKNPPAGVPVKLIAAVEFENGSKKNLIYSWNFSDNVTEKTSENSVFHIFDEVGEYTITVEVSAGGNSTSEKKFIINTVSPGQAINYTLKLKEKALKDATSEVASLPAWYQSAVKEELNLSDYNKDMTWIKSLINDAYDDEDYIEIAQLLYASDFPSSVTKTEVLEFPLMTESSDIDASIIDEYDGSAVEDYEDYVNPILRWQTEFVDSMIKSELVSASFYSGDSGDVLRAYSVSVTQNDYDTAYFVINKPIEEINFIRSVDYSESEGSVIIELEPGVTKTFSFYLEGNEEATFFVSPSLDELVTDVKIDKTCDFDSVCEPENGENPSTCRSDCKPAGMMVFWLILSFIFILFVYTVLQVWYKRHYEDYLFEDRRQMYNLLMFVSNARARGQKDDEIESALKKQGWSSERVHYIMKKSRGQNVGMVEIIPIDRIAAMIRAGKAKSKVRKETRLVSQVATRPQQQIGANFNKSKRPGALR